MTGKAGILSLLTVVLAALLSAGCHSARPASHTAPQIADPQAPVWPPSLAPETLAQCAQPVGVTGGLEIGVVVFDSGIDNPDERDARHKLREVEARLVATSLRDVLTETGCWGPSRVLPSRSQFAALTLSGEIIHSDGRDLVVGIEAVDASGAIWLATTLHAAATASDYQNNASEPFETLFIAVANQLLRAAASQDLAEIRRLEQIALMRYAAELSPEGFGEYLEVIDGRTKLRRLPADNDPMLLRIDRIRNQEALFIDTVDEQYIDLRQQLGDTYRLWRRSSFEQADYLDQYTARAARRELEADAGSFAAMQQVYSTFRSVRIQEQDLFELATGFDNETAPTVMKSGERVVSLSGTLEQQYAQWRSILGQIIQLERGLTP